jgi:hypothetical protein
MSLSEFSVVHERSGGGSNFDDSLIHCFDGKRLVLAFVARQALDDYFRVPDAQRRTLEQWNLVTERNRHAFARVISAKYERGERSVTFDSLGESFPLVLVTLQDMESSGEEFSDDVLNIKAE